MEKIVDKVRDDESVFFRDKEKTHFLKLYSLDIYIILHYITEYYKKKQLKEINNSSDSDHFLSNFDDFIHVFKNVFKYIWKQQNKLFMKCRKLI
jgi:hypothetical protein